MPTGLRSALAVLVIVGLAGCTPQSPPAGSLDATLTAHLAVIAGTQTVAAQQTVIAGGVPPATSTPRPTELPAPPQSLYQPARQLVLLLPDLSAVPADQRDAAVAGVADVVGRRIETRYGPNAGEVAIRDGTVVASARTGDPEFRKLVSKAGLLEFREQDGRLWQNAAGTIDWEARELTGRYLVPGRQRVAPSIVAGQAAVALEFNPEGADLMRQISQRLIGRQLGIFLDGELVSAPTVQAVIGDHAQITGLTEAEAHLLAIQLNTGVLPVPVSIAE